MQALRRQTPFVAAIAATLLAVSLAYANSFSNSFHFDDFHTITDNPAIRSLNNVPRFFTDTTTFSVLPPNRTYRPIVSTSLALDYAMGHGYNLHWFHASTFLWFLVLLGVLYLFYERMFGQTEASSANKWLALIAAAWFGLHPAMAETVNYIIQRGDLYCTLGCVASLTMWARMPAWRKYGLYLLPLIMALLSKPPAAVFPILLLFYVFFFEAEGAAAAARWKKSLLAILPSLVMVALGMGLHHAMTPKSFLPSIISAADYRMTQPYVWLRYLGQMFFPLHLNVDTDLEATSGLTEPIVAGFLMLLVLGVGIWFTSRRRKLYPIAFGLIWFIVTQLPTSLYALSEVENDHRMFFSFAGLMPGVVWGSWLFLRWLFGNEVWPKVRPVIVVCVLLALSGYAWGVHVRNQVWHSDETLWKDDAEKSPHNGRGLMNYGLTMLNSGDFKGAYDEFERAAVYTPNYPTLEINLGIASTLAGHEDESEAHFQRAISLDPQDDLGHAFYGRWLTDHGRYTEAAAQDRLAIDLNPQRLMGHEELARATQLFNSTDAANQGSAAAVSAPAFVNQSLALNQAGKYKESISAAREALKIEPHSAEAWNNIAAGYEALHKWDLAIDAAKKAIALKPDFQLAKNNLIWSEQQKQLEATKTKP